MGSVKLTLTKTASPRYFLKMGKNYSDLASSAVTWLKRGQNLCTQTQSYIGVAQWEPVMWQRDAPPMNQRSHVYCPEPRAEAWRMGIENYSCSGHMTAILLPPPNPQPGGEPRCHVANARVVFVPRLWPFWELFLKVKIFIFGHSFWRNIKA